MKKRKNKDDKKSGINSYARYSGIAFEMLGIISLGTFAGIKIDEKRNAEFPLFTTILSLVSVFIALFVVLKNIIIKK